MIVQYYKRFFVILALLNSMLKRRFTVYLTLFIFGNAVAQEHLVPLRTNPVLRQYAKKNSGTLSQHRKEGVIFPVLISDSIVITTLPFLDDFSRPLGPYPNINLWMDRAAYVNVTYPASPVNIGVATLDGLNSEGLPYDPSCPPQASEPADSLTSRPIALNNYKPLDSLYLSFYWQAGGVGYPPNNTYSPPKYTDTLILQFRTDQIPWTTMWYMNGYAPQPPDTGFHFVMLPLSDYFRDSVFTDGLWVHLDSKWFAYNFQFRFKNYACTSGNLDHWNIDGVYLNAHRGYDDTLFKEVAFVYESPSLLTNYEAMPYNQVRANDFKDSIFSLTIRNNYNAELLMANFTCSISTSPPTIYNVGGVDVPSFMSSGNYFQYHPVINPQLSTANFTFPLTGWTTYTVAYYYNNTEEFDRRNDTLRYEQVFKNYYAYDDGTAEAGYFINSIPDQPASLAYQFTLNHPDTIVGLEIYFNYILVNSNNYYFRLCLWDNSGSGGTPGNLTFEDTTLYNPEYIDSLDGFAYYPFHLRPDTVVGGTFYVGWIQTYGDSLNIGYDLNTDHHTMIYYNTGTGWTQGIYPGSMMMRPVFGNRFYNGINKINTTNNELNIYPNPTNSYIYINQSLRNTIITIYSVDGKVVIQLERFTGNEVDVSALPEGFYIIKINDSFSKLIIER